MNRPYMILYRGMMAERTLTGKKALRRAQELIAAKGWKPEDVKIELEVAR